MSSIFRDFGLIAAMALTTLVSTPASATSSIEGFWHTADGDGLVEVKPCGGKLCGYLVDHDRLRANPAAMDEMNVKPAMRTRPMMDMLLLDHFNGGPTEWAGGEIYNPDNGKSYSGMLRLLDSNRLKITGCLVRPFCGSQVWTRAK